MVMKANVDRSKVQKLIEGTRKNFLFNELTLIIQELKNDFFDIPCIHDPLNPSASNRSLVERLNEIKSFLQQRDMFSYLHTIQKIQFILLEKIGIDTAGISKTIGQHLRQLRLNNQSRSLFVELDIHGLNIYCDTNIGRDELSGYFESLGIEFSKHESSPLDQDYVDAAYVIQVGHTSIEKLLYFVQYHPYHLHKALDDLYQAKGLKRSLCVVNALQSESIKSFYPQDKNLDVGDVCRGEFSENQDLLTVEVAALQAKSNIKAKHIVLLVDDSGSMKTNNRMSSVKQAIKKIIDTLPDETIITIQPFNAINCVTKKSIGEIRANNTLYQKATNMSADGGTPLGETLINSALFLRTNDSPQISIEALNQTTIVLLTDGEPTDIRQADKVIEAIHDGSMVSYKSNFNYMGENKDIFYGVGKFAPPQLPPVFTVAISEDAHYKFIKELSDLLDSPFLFVSDKKGNIAEDLDTAFETLTALSGRIPHVFVGISYWNPKESKQVMCAESIHNLFYGYSKTVNFNIPACATNIKVTLYDPQSNYAENMNVCMTKPLVKDPLLNKNHTIKQFNKLVGEYQNVYNQYKVKLVNEQDWRPQAISRFSDKSVVVETKQEKALILPEDFKNWCMILDPDISTLGKRYWNIDSMDIPLLSYLITAASPFKDNTMLVCPVMDKKNNEIAYYVTFLTGNNVFYSKENKCLFFNSGRDPFNEDIIAALKPLKPGEVPKESTAYQAIYSRVEQEIKKVYIMQPHIQEALKEAEERENEKLKAIKAREEAMRIEAISLFVKSSGMKEAVGLLLECQTDNVLIKEMMAFLSCISNCTEFNRKMSESLSYEEASKESLSRFGKPYSVTPIFVQGNANQFFQTNNSDTEDNRSSSVANRFHK